MESPRVDLRRDADEASLTRGCSPQFSSSFCASGMSKGGGESGSWLRFRAGGRARPAPTTSPPTALIATPPSIASSSTSDARPTRLGERERVCDLRASKEDEEGSRPGDRVPRGAKYGDREDRIKPAPAPPRYAATSSWLAPPPPPLPPPSLPPLLPSLISSLLVEGGHVCREDASALGDSGERILPSSLPPRLPRGERGEIRPVVPSWS